MSIIRCHTAGRRRSSSPQRTWARCCEGTGLKTLSTRYVWERHDDRPAGWCAADGVAPARVQIAMRVDEQCKVLCRIESLSGAQAKAFRAKVEDDYRVNM